VRTTTTGQSLLTMADSETHSSAPNDEGWRRVDRSIEAARDALASATSEEGFQVVGLLCREALISLAQVVYDPEIHTIEDGVVPSPTDAKRMLSAYIGAALPGQPNEVARRHAKAALDLAIELQHRRTAAFRDAALCLEATRGVVNSVEILSGRREPSAYRSSESESHAAAARQASEIIERSQNRSVSLSQCIAEAAKLAREVGDSELEAFCTSELTGYSASTEEEYKRIFYRGMQAYCSPGLFNMSNPLLAGNASAIFAYTEAHPDQFFVKNLIIQESVSAIEQRVRPIGPGMFIKTTLSSSVFGTDLSPPIPIHCYSRADGYAEILERIRTQLVQRLIRVIRGAG
jgi:hypothetical protein